MTATPGSVKPSQVSALITTTQEKEELIAAMASRKSFTSFNREFAALISTSLSNIRCKGLAKGVGRV